MTTVFFATNRAEDKAAPFGFSDTAVDFDAQKITFAKAEVANISLNDESSGVIQQITDKTYGNFSAKTTVEIISRSNNLLVFIHGFDNSFEDAVKRAAFNREWLAASGVAAADTTVIAFSWPSTGMLFAAPPHMPPDAYLADQARAARSAFHIAYFLRVVDQIQASYRKANPAGRVFLLAHSMGNHALSGAVQLWFNSNDPPDAIFDEAVLAAGDEVAQTLNLPAMGQMTGLRQLAKRISVYHSRIDVAMYLSTTLNLTQRLGFDGPTNKHDESVFPKSVFRIVDCTDVSDYDHLKPPDATHQYYRRSKWVRADIAGVFSGK